MELQKNDITLLRIQNSGLITPFDNIESCIRNLVGIQSQAQQFGEISILNRVENLKQEDLRQLYDSYDIIKIWGQRMTVHMYSKKDWKVIHQVYAHRNSFIKRGWQENKATLEKLLLEIAQLKTKQKIDKLEIAELIQNIAPHITNEYRDYSIIIQSTLDAILFGIPQMPQTKHFAHRSVCIDEDDFKAWGSNKEQSLHHLLSTYFRFYGPATISDFRHWSGLTQREIQDCFSNLKNELISVSVSGKNYYGYSENLQLSGWENESIKLLGKFDPLFVSFSDKSWIATPEQQKAIWRPAGHVEAVVLINGKLAGTWRYSIKGKKINFSIHPFLRITSSQKKKIAVEAKKIAQFLEKQLDKIEYE